jgi:hypothetical protein
VLNPVTIATHAARAGWRGADLVVAVAVALAESGGNETRPGGLWNLGTAGPPGTPAVQAQQAYARWKSGGWGQWASHRGNAYLLFMPLAAAAAASAEVAGIIRDPAGVPGRVVGSITEAAKDLPGADMLSAIQGPIALAYKAGAWMANPGSWERVAQVIVGGGLIIASVVMLARPAVGAVSGGAVGMIAKPLMKGLKS